MRFALDEDREALRSTARDLLTELCPPAAVRAAWTQAPDPAPWQALTAAGALSVLVPQSDGGLGLDETYLVPVLEEAGRAALPHPLTATALVAAPLGAVGPIVATDLGAVGPIAGHRPRRSGADAGHRPAVPSATFAESFLLVSGRGLRLYEAHEVDVEPMATVDASRHCGRVQPRARGETVTEDPDAVAAAFDRGVLGAAAELVGLSRAMLELTVDYAAQRHQFGRPIGSFQAVKHHLANARIQIEFASSGRSVRRLCRRPQPPRGHPQRVAGQVAGRRPRPAVTGRAALQCHGAIGYTTEYDLHLYLKRSWALARSWGGADFHADRVAASIRRI